MTPAVGDNMKNSHTDQNDCNRGAGHMTGRPGRALAGLLCLALGVSSVFVESTSCSADEVRKGRGRKESTTAVAEKKPASGEKSSASEPSSASEQSSDAVKPGSLGELIDQQIRQGWADNEIKPSDVATDEEWVRRVYLDVLGRIPTLEEVKAFLADEDPRKRSALVDSLLENEDYVRNMTTIWTNNCIGRGAPQRVSRSGMEKFFRDAFAKGRPWRDIVVDIVTSEGHYEENGAVNFILAQMQNRDDGVQLTAATTRLFLGLQGCG